MPLSPGVRLGVYEIHSTLGEGGMGAVYRARDVKLGRDVAIKVILDVFAAEPDRVARFEREAKVLAALNHPHIAALYGMDQSDGQHFLVMELVEGQTLADRLQRGALTPSETVGIALQIAEALEAAHEKGIVHRDLKPANVKITPDDRVKVLDFGLAKAIENETTAANVANSPTLSMMASQAGIILGTAAYMSPEQAKGFPADHRSDIFSFGSVMYEMLTGRQPFHGDTAPEVLASVLVRDPDITRLPQTLDPRLTDLVRRCLEKHPKRRWQAVGDVRAELEAIAAAPRAQSSVHMAVVPRPLWRRALPVAATSLIVGALAAAGAWVLKPVPHQPVVRFAVRLPSDQIFTTPARGVLALSPDGTSLVYVSNNQLQLRPLGGFETRAISGTTGLNISSPAISPDSRAVVFFSATDLTLKRLPITGGVPVTLCPATNPFGVSWTEDAILFGQSIGSERGIMRVHPSGGKPVMIASVKGDESAYGPQLLPGGATVLFTLARATGTDRWDSAQIVAQTLSSGERKVVIEGGADARYLPTGHLAYVRKAVVYVVPFDARSARVTGDAVPVIEGVRRSASGITGFADFSFSGNGTLAYVPGPLIATGGQVDIGLVDIRGGISRLKLSGPFQTPRASPDGTRIAFTSDDGREADVYVYNLAGTTAMQRLTYGGNNHLPIWSADGKRVAFESDREGDHGIFWQAADGTGPVERLTKSGPGESHQPLAWHPQGDVLLFEVTKGPEISLWTYSRSEKKTTPFGGVRSNMTTGAVFSPDGRWVAYAAGDRTQTLFVQPFPATGAKYELRRVDGGANPHHPVWSPDGSRIYYVPRPAGWESVSITTSPSFGFGNPVEGKRPFQGSPPNENRPYDMMRDGRVLAFLTPGEPDSTTVTPLEINVVLNWFDDMKARLSSER